LGKNNKSNTFWNSNINRNTNVDIYISALYILPTPTICTFAVRRNGQIAFWLLQNIFVHCSVPYLGGITLRPLSFRTRSFRPGHFVPSFISSPVISSPVILSPGHFVPWSFRPLELNVQKFMPSVPSKYNFLYTHYPEVIAGFLLYDK
jgi:hypothetical protein